MGREATMSKDLLHLVRAQEDRLAADLARDLHRGNASHYQGASRDLLELRCRRLVGAFVESTEGNPAPFVAYVRRIAEERIAEGYDLAEVQQALTLLEWKIWRIVADACGIDDLLHHLSIVSGAVGSAKDELARVFVAHKERVESAAGELELQSLFKGTEGHVDPEPDPARAARRGR
jgi:hypothetical protein